MTMQWPLTMGLALLLGACAGASQLATDAAAGDGDVASAADGKDAAAGQQFVCNQVMGVSVTGEWYAGGFEAAVDDGRWQAMTLSHAYVELWSDPTNTVWATPLASPCTSDSGDPDRVLFVGCNWTYTTTAEWQSAFTAVVANLKAKYPNLKRIELLTMLRAPGNQLCAEAVNNETIVQPFIDEAIANVVAANPGLVTAAPKFQAPNCDVFVLGGPHLTPDGQAAVAKVYSDYYANQP